MSEIVSRSKGGQMYSLLEGNLSGLGISDSPKIVSVLCSLFERVVTANEKQLIKTNHTPVSKRSTIFHGLRAPSISIRKYVERIFKYAHCSPCCFVVAYAYIDRFMHQQPGFPITALNVHRLLMTSVMIAAKFLDDTHYNNAYYAKVGGVMTEEMNRLEIEFLFQIEFRLHVTLDDFQSYCLHLERDVTLNGGYQIERALQVSCGLNGSSAEEDSERRRLSVRCSYAGL